MKMSTIVILAVLILCSTFFPCESFAGLTKEQRIDDARTIISLFRHRYAPIEWKEKYLGISFDGIADNLLEAVSREDMTDEEFYTELAKVSASVKDSHNWIILPSHYSARLGISTDYVEGKVLIDEVDRNILPGGVFPFERGDEVVSIDGRGVRDIMDELMELSSEANEQYNLRESASALTNRVQFIYPVVPSGESLVEIKSRSSGRTSTVKMKWITRGTPMSTTITAGIIDSLKSSETPIPENSFLERMRRSKKAYASVTGSGIESITPFYPLWNDFEKITDDPVIVGKFPLGGYTVGFVRINTWDPDDPERWFQRFVEFIPKLDKETDVLLIDQTDNPGGYLCLHEGVVQLLATEPIPSNLYQWRANRFNLMNLEEDELECDSGENDDEQECALIRMALDNTRAAIKRGDFLVPAIPECYPDGYIRPAFDDAGNPIHYTKPILILVNERSVSAADMFPAILQDGGRAVIFGSRTCGAGGSNTTTSIIGNSDVKVGQTEGLAIRPSPIISPLGMETDYIENVGVIPDVEYEITGDDFVNGYKGYKAAIEETIRAMLTHKPLPAN